MSYATDNQGHYILEFKSCKAGSLPPATLTIDQIKAPFKWRSFAMRIEPKTFWMVGTLNEFISSPKESQLSLKQGSWVLGDYSDHLWSMYGHHNRFDTSTELHLHRITTGDIQYGLISRAGLKQAQLWIAEDIEDGSEPNEDRVRELYANSAEETGGSIMLGRGEDTYHVYIAKDEKEQVVAWTLLIPQVIEDIVES